VEQVNEKNGIEWDTDYFEFRVDGGFGGFCGERNIDWRAVLVLRLKASFYPTFINQFPMNPVSSSGKTPFSSSGKTPILIFIFLYYGMCPYFLIFLFSRL
jgi:hypothetical protein